MCLQRHTFGLKFCIAKEKAMENRNFLWTLTSIALVFGMMVIGCPQEDNTEPSKNPKSSAADILTLKIGDVAGAINETEIQVRVPLSSNFDVEAVRPAITLSDRATISPSMGIAVDFSKPVEYTVTAEDGTTKKKYTVSIVQIAVVTDGNLKAVLDKISKGGSYDIEMASNNIGFAPYTFPEGSKEKSKDITLSGSGTARTIGLSSSQKGYLFTVGQYVTLTLEDITLQGISDNNTALINVELFGNLVLESGAKISGNTNTTTSGLNAGGGVFSTGTTTINGGEISGNSTHMGGGIYADFSRITLNSGKISNNTAKYGGGVYGNITVNGGEISGNNGGEGGGVNGNVIITGGAIKNNTATSFLSALGRPIGGRGGGVHGRLTMSGGTIEGNTAVSTTITYPSQGGGVYSGNSTISQGADSVLSGGTITNNTADQGGGIYVPSSGSLMMSKDIKITPSTSTVCLEFYKSSTTGAITNGSIPITESLSGSGIIANLDIYGDSSLAFSEMIGKSILTGNIDNSVISRFVLNKYQYISNNTLQNEVLATKDGGYSIAANGILKKN